MGATVGQLCKTYDDRQLRGGPAVRQDMYIAPWFFMNGDDRKAVVPYFNANFFESSDKRNWSVSYGPEIDLKAMGRFTSGISGNCWHTVSDTQFYGKSTNATNRLHYPIPNFNHQ